MTYKSRKILKIITIVLIAITMIFLLSACSTDENEASKTELSEEDSQKLEDMNNVFQAYETLMSDSHDIIGAREAFNKVDSNSEIANTKLYQLVDGFIKTAEGGKNVWETVSGTVSEWSDKATEWWNDFNSEYNKNQ